MGRGLYGFVELLKELQACLGDAHANHSSVLIIALAIHPPMPFQSHEETGHVWRAVQ